VLDSAKLLVIISLIRKKANKERYYMYQLQV